MIDGGQLDDYVTEILQRATGHDSVMNLRVIVRKVYDLGVIDGMEQMLYPGTPEEQQAAAARGHEALGRAAAEAEQTRYLLQKVVEVLEEKGLPLLARQLASRFLLDAT